MDYDTIVYKLQKYQNKLEHGLGDKTMYNAKIEYYQKYLLEGGWVWPWNRKKGVAPIADGTNSGIKRNNSPNRVAMKNKLPVAPPLPPPRIRSMPSNQQLSISHHANNDNMCIHTTLNSTMRNDPRLKEKFNEINNILRDVINKKIYDITSKHNIERMTTIIFEINNIIKNSKINDKDKDTAYRELIKMQECFENNRLVDINIYGEEGDRQIFMKMRDHYARLDFSHSPHLPGTPPIGNPLDRTNYATIVHMSLPPSAPALPPRRSSAPASSGKVVYESRRVPNTPSPAPRIFDSSALYTGIDPANRRLPSPPGPPLPPRHP